MSSMMGYEFFGTPVFSSDLPPVNSIDKLNVTNAIYDEVYIREYTDDTVDITSTKNQWLPDTRLDAKFQGDLEAGDINNEGVQIQSFVVKRRMSTDPTYNNVQISTLPFVNGQNVTFTDMTQPVGDLIYSIVPLGSNGLLGRPNEISVTSDFYGWWIVDKDTQKGYLFDMTPTNDTHNMMVYGTVDTQLNQGRIQIDTMSQYPQLYYYDTQYVTLQLSALFNPTTQSFDDWNNMVSMFTAHKPLIVKSGSGDLYVMDIYAPKKTTLLNAYKGVDYYVMNVSAIEIQDYYSFMTGYTG